MKFLKFRKYNTKKNSIVLLLFVMFFLFVLPSAEAQKKYTIILDAGHGGKDPGASNGSFIEKKIALKVALEVGKQLKKDKDIKVVYTRNDDTFIELHKRATIANENDAALFVSLHCDSFKPNPKAYGASTYVLGLNGNATNMEIAKKENAVILLEDNYRQNYDYDPNSPESVIGLSVLQEENLDESLAFASTVQSNFIKAKRKDRSVKQANFLVLRETVMPSVLIELGFLSNDKEGKYLNSRAGQINIATAIASAIKRYVNQLKVNTITQRKATKEKAVVPKLIEKPKKEIAVKEKKKHPQPEKKKVLKEQPKKQEVVQKPKVEEPKNIVTDAKKKANVIKPHEPVRTQQQIKKTESKPVKTIPYIEFKVQIAASKKYIEPQPNNFKGLKNIDVKVIDKYYKYYYGSSSDYTMIKEYLQDAKDAGVKGAFVVAFENGVKIPLYEAIKKQ